MGFFNRFKRKRDFAEAIKNARIVATIPDAPILYQFWSVKDFWCKELRSQYTAGGVYVVRKGNEKLDLFVKKWVAEGKVRRGT